MDKAINGNGWAFRPADGGKPAMWAGNDSIYNVYKTSASGGQAIAQGGGGCLAISIVFFPIVLIASSISTSGSGTAFMWLMLLTAFGGGVVLAVGAVGQKEWLGSKWRLQASGSGLIFSTGDKSEKLEGKPALWAVAFDEIARIESGATVEWEKVREYVGAFGTKPRMGIPDAEMQVFIFTSDGRRLVVHTANAAREDCGRLAHSIRSYVETQRGNAAPSPSSPSATSSPAADGFDL